MRSSSNSIWAFIKKWKYRYDVTLPLYVMTSSEKFILNSFLFTCLVLLATAIYTYTPVQIQVVVRRAYYYYSGVDTSVCLDDDKVPSSSSAGVLSAGCV
ncbi:hypothetical protein V1517DRAFT_43142 [Lipomyces orientalis]|uniref:Uncharacterized protein n=1 Tax=Lipomyces orientalis TaxID=1233043 RepID=A0ACC3TU83_9ASCO